MTVTIVLRDGRKETFDNVEGWAVNEPEGWTHVVFDGQAVYFPRDMIESVILPLVKESVEDEI